MGSKTRWEQTQSSCTRWRSPTCTVLALWLYGASFLDPWILCVGIYATSLSARSLHMYYDPINSLKNTLLPHHDVTRLVSRLCPSKVKDTGTPLVPEFRYYLPLWDSTIIVGDPKANGNCDTARRTIDAGEGEQQGYELAARLSTRC